MSKNCYEEYMISLIKASKMLLKKVYFVFRPFSKPFEEGLFFPFPSIPELVSPHFSIPNILSPEYKEPFLSKNVLKEEQPKA